MFIYGKTVFIKDCFWHIFCKSNSETRLGRYGCCLKHDCFLLISFKTLILLSSVLKRQLFLKVPSMDFVIKILLNAIF